MNVPLSGEDAKAYFLRQERHWSAQAAAALGADSDSDEDLDDKKRDRRDKKRMLVLKKKARELSDAVFASASSSVPLAQVADALPKHDMEELHEIDEAKALATLSLLDSDAEGATQRGKR
jgi:hypothetical protein